MNAGGKIPTAGASGDAWRSYREQVDKTFSRPLFPDYGIAALRLQ